MIRNIETIERSACGYWVHPDYDSDEFYDDMNFTSVWMEDDNPELFERYMTGDPDVSAWNPTPVSSEAVLIFISDTDDGPLAMFAVPSYEVDDVS